MYYSQFGEDKILHEIFQKKNGVCVEVGANNGVDDSNSYFFEQLGWTCVLIEPNPMLCHEIRKVRNARLYECAASSEFGSATLYIAEGAERAHGVSTISSNPEIHNQIKSYGFSERPIQVKTRTLDDLLLESNLAGSIDFVSIDVEGHELQVLEGFSIESWKPSVFVIEDNSNHENDEVRKYLKKYGYEVFKRTGVNDWYALRSNKDLINLKSQTQYVYIKYTAKIKRRLKKIPLLVGLVAWVKKKIIK